MLTDWMSRLLQIWPESLLASAVIVVCIAVGWRAGGISQSLVVQVVSWWLKHIVHPLLRSHSWIRRAMIIAANNSLICAVVVLLGSLGSIAWLGMLGIGLGLGIALRLMLSDPMVDMDQERPLASRERLLMTAGLLLNLLELPAIALTGGLALSQGAWSSTLVLAEAMGLYILVVLPLLLGGAAGEALWMTVSLDRPRIEPPA